MTTLEEYGQLQRLIRQLQEERRRTTKTYNVKSANIYFNDPELVDIPGRITVPYTFSEENFEYLKTAIMESMAVPETLIIPTKVEWTAKIVSSTIVPPGNAWIVDRSDNSPVRIINIGETDNDKNENSGGSG